MGVRSHVDPCAFVLFMHVRDAQLTDELARTVAALDPRPGDPFGVLLERLGPRGYQVLFHELYHYWQGLRLPFLLRYALVAFMRVWQAFGRLVREGGPRYELWSAAIPELYRLELASRVGFMPGGRIFWGGADGPPPAGARTLALTPLDLLECAASLAEYQVTSAKPERTSPEALARWRKRNPAYLDPYDFAAAFLGDDRLALRALLPLINATFHTSEPARTFVELLARLGGTFADGDEATASFLAQPEPVRWPELLASWLDRITYEAAADSGVDILGGAYQRLTVDRWAFGEIGGADEGFVIHPFLGPAARRWRGLEAAHPELGLAMDFPGWVSAGTIGVLRRELDPPFAVFRFHLPDAPDRVFLWGDGGGISPEFTSFPFADDAALRGFIADFLTMYGVVRRASHAHYDDDQRTCHHTGCPHYAANFCNAYPIIPDRHEDCGFPSRIERLVHLERSRHASATTRSR